MRSFAWAAFLGCSWTWCIGMFLPVLLVRDLGVGGWLVFALPNVAGAAAMGWVIGSPETSRRLVESHGRACAAFSAVTLAFHVFFVLWFVPRLVGLPPAAIAFALAAVYLLATLNRPGADLSAACLSWAISLAMLVLFVHRTPQLDVPLHGTRPSINVLWLAPVCIFGFLLCPYLDLTFHRARQQLGATESRVAFGVGFGVCFLAMIVFSLLYASTLWPLLGARWLRPALGWVIATHLIVQSAFTVAVHARAFVAARVTPGGVFGLLVLVQLALVAAVGANLLPRYHGMDAGELIYRAFIAFYGLLFPTYVWVCMVPRRGDEPGRAALPGPIPIRAMLLGVLLAAPMYWMGFIEDRFVWLVPGVAAVLLSRYAVPRGLAQLALPSSSSSTTTTTTTI